MTDTPLVPEDAFGLIRSFTRHVGYVKFALGKVSNAIQERATVHDLSKLLDDEFSGFSRINKAARVNKFGSPEYAEGLRREKGTIDQHYARNRHHPEYYTEFDAGGTSMSFLDIIEMVCDWWGAGKGYDSKMSWEKSVDLNIENKGKHLSAEQLWLAREVAAFLGEECGR